MRVSIRSVFPILALGLISVAAQGCSPEAKKTRHLEKAQRHLASSEYDSAEIEYMNVLKIEPANPEAVSKLGIIYFEQGRSGRVFPFLYKARQLQPENLDVHLKLGQSFLSVGRFAEARAEAEFVLARKPEIEDAPLLLAEASLEPADVVATRQRLQSLPPSAVEKGPVIVALGLLDFRERKIKQAESAFKHALTLNTKLARAQSALGALYWTQNNLSEADRAFATAVQLSAIRSPTRIQYAQFKSATGDAATAKGLLQDTTKQAPDYLAAWMGLAEISVREKKYDESTAAVAKVLERDPLHPDALLLSARLQLVKGEPDKAVAEFERIAKIYPQAPSAHYQLGMAYATTGDIAKATGSLNQAITLAPGFPEAIVGLATLNIRKGDYRASIAPLKQLVQQRPDILQARILLANAYRGIGSLDETLAVYQEMAASFPKMSTIRYEIGLVALQQNRKEEARRAFGKVLELEPNYVPAVEQLINLDLLEKRYPAALQRVDVQITKNPKSPDAQLLLAKVFLAQNDTGSAEMALQKAINLQPSASSAYFQLARLYYNTGQLQKALTRLQELAEKNPKDAETLTLIGVLLDEQKDYPAAVQTYEKLLTIDPNSGVALNNLAYLYSEQLGELEKGYQMAQKARQALPQDPNVADTLGWILYRKNQYRRALNLLEESVEKLPSSAPGQYHVGMTHYMMGEEQLAHAALQLALQLDRNFRGVEDAQQCLAILAIDPSAAAPDARAVLEKRVADRPDDSVAVIRLATVLERSGALGKAINSYEKALQINPNNLKALLSLIRIHTERHNTQKAFELAKTAHKIAPDDSDVTHALGRLAFQSGDFPWSRSLLQEVALKHPDDPDVLFDLAQAFYSVGRVSDAETAMRHASQSGAGFSHSDDAKLFLEFITLPSDPAQVAAAANRADQVLKTDAANVPALMVLAAIYDQKHDGSAALETYNKVLGRYPDFTPAKKRLAILYAANASDNQRAFDLAVKAREDFPDDSELAKAFGVILYRQKDFARATKVLEESAAQRADDAEVMYYLGMARYGLKQRAGSKQALQRALDMKLGPDLAPDAKKTLADLK